MNSNSFHDVVTLVVASGASLYVVSWLAKCIESSIIGKSIAYVGKESFYVMGLHFFGFKVCSMLLIFCGLDINFAELKAPAHESIWMLCMYLLFGVSIPLLFMWIFRKIRDSLLRQQNIAHN